MDEHPPPPPPPPPSDSPRPAASGINVPLVVALVLGVVGAFGAITIRAVIATNEPERPSDELPGFLLETAVIAVLALIILLVGWRRHSETGRGRRLRWVALGFVVLAGLATLGQLGTYVNEDAASSRDCRAADDRFGAALVGPYDAVTAASATQREAIAAGTVLERGNAQRQVFERLVDLGAAARSNVPCTEGAQRLRLLALDMGDNAALLLRLDQDARAGVMTDSEFRPEFARLGEDLNEARRGFNEEVAGLFSGPGPE